MIRFSDIVWAINLAKDHLQDLTQRMRHFAAEILTAAEIDLEFFAPERDARMGANLRREVFLILLDNIKEAVSGGSPKSPRAFSSCFVKSARPKPLITI